MNAEKIFVGTHAVKALDSRNKQSALRVELNDLGNDVFASHLLKTRYYAVPNNAANLTVARLEAEQANADQRDISEYGTAIPKIQDGKVKQILLPFLDDYLSVTPVPSLHVMDLVNQYSLSFNTFMKHCIQPIGASTANHGDPVCANRGFMKLIRNWIPKSNPRASAIFNQPVIIIKARCENMNISSSYVAMGLPQLTAIGGFVHSLERHVGVSLPFAFGIQYFNSRQATTVKRGSVQIKKANDTHKNVIATDEITVNAQIAFALNANNPDTLAKIQDYAMRLNRFSGGTLFDVSVQLTDCVDGYYWYQKDSDPTSIQNLKTPEDIDYKLNITNAEILQKYSAWEEKYPLFSNFLKSLNFNYRLIQSGYALLNEPVNDDLARSDSKLHAWAEPVFSLIELGNQPDFFELNTRNNLFIWK